MTAEDVLVGYYDLELRDKKMVSRLILDDLDEEYLEEDDWTWDYD